MTDSYTWRCTSNKNKQMKNEQQCYRVLASGRHSVAKLQPSTCSEQTTVNSWLPARAKDSLQCGYNKKACMNSGFRCCRSEDEPGPRVHGHTRTHVLPVAYVNLPPHNFMFGKELQIRYLTRSASCFWARYFA